MAFRLFTIPIASPDAATDELNAFLRTRRVLKVDRQWVDQGTSSLWSLCVEYLDGAPAGGEPAARPGAARAKADYKDLLPPADFAVFAQLRDVRKAISQAEAVPVYTIFTNEQLAQMVTARATTKAALGKIDGVGGARLDRYGPRVLEVLSRAWASEAGHEAGGNLFDAIRDRDNLLLAAWKAGRGKRGRPEVRDYFARLGDRLADLADGLAAGTFPVGRWQQFVIRDPKVRVITAPCFAERVLHHAVMNVLEPHVERWLIADTYACRPGKGRPAAVARAGRFAASHGWFLSLDVRAYFDSVSHDVLLAALARRVKDARLLALLGRVVAAYRGSLGRGLPIGSLLSQHLANLYLDPFDRFVKETRRARGYVRYMDDIVVWADGRAELDDALAGGTELLRDRLRLEPKPTPFVNRTAHGLDFLGARVYPTHVTLGRRSRARFRRRLRDLDARLAAGGPGERAYQQRATALAAFAAADGIRSWRFRRRVLWPDPGGGRTARTG